jgi:hypothetical protein
MQLPHARGNIRHRLRRLEKRGWVDMGRSPEGKAAQVIRPPAGHKAASTLNKRVNKE